MDDKKLGWGEGGEKEGGRGTMSENSWGREEMDKRRD